MDVNLVTVLALLTVAVSQTSEMERYRDMNKFWAATYRITKVSFARGCGLAAVERTPALFPGAFNCCTKISDEIPKGILPRVERFEIQKADGLCHLEAVILYIGDRKFCVSPQIRRVKKWMKKKHKIAGKKAHGRKQRRSKSNKKERSSSNMMKQVP